ncbi:hypothetical protein Tco_0924504 [Tanacetum coccineum]|uniref:Uncharacterized protein n=1 Tax=Tanacetum coccineum TaxID=301880 RepID=A0ABQ5D408_9ASTR
MENANPPPALDPPTLPTTLRAEVIHELRELLAISAYIDSRLENIDQFLRDFTTQPNIIDMGNAESNNGLTDTPLVSLFLDSGDDSNEGEVLNELEEYGNEGKLCERKIINSFDGDELAFQWGSPAGIHGLFSGWYCGLASRKVTLGVSMTWAKRVTTWTLCALSLDKLAMPPHFHKKFRMGVAIARGCRGYYKPGTRAWVRRGSRKICIPIDMYPCRVEERLTIKLVKGEEVLKIETTVTAKDGTITKFLGKFPEYKPTKEEEEIFKLKAIYENVIYDISDSDSDLESTARSGPRDSEMEDTGSSGIRINA